jgi:5-methylcytosine-specific restriction endonuclease McrA
MNYFGYGEQDVILCEACGRPAVDIHHINGRVGEDANKIENLMALCRKCHTKAHEGKLSKGELQYIHNNFLLGNRKQFIK